jgi:hypothetical protein
MASPCLQGHCHAFSAKVSSIVGYMQIWSRGTADSCFYMGEQYQFCNIDMFRRRSRYPPPDAPLASC